MGISNGMRWLAIVGALLVPNHLAAQATATLSGRVTGEGGALVGVEISVTHQVSGSRFGAITQSDGRYLVIGLRPGGPYRVEARMIGYGLQAVDAITLAAGQTRTVDFNLSTEAIAIDAIEVFASRAVARRTPVAFTNVDKVQIQNQLGSRDLPMVLNVTPSVYATLQGGGAGDARINVRGFSQRNTAVMINGVPVNDMENGWVYWSNWDGLGDASASIQLQRGLSAVNLATPSIGGTLNVLTDPSAMRRGFSYKQEFGTGDFLKETVVAHTGEMGGFALTASVVRKTGKGLFEFNRGKAAWTDASAYYLASSYQVNAKNRLEFYAVGAPQRHGQNLYKLNIGTLSHEFARSLKDYDAAALAKFPEAGREWSPNVNKVSPSYTGKQFASTGPGSGVFSRYDAGYLNERENYFHKPQLNLNWYSYFGNGLTLSTVGYYSGGNGGGTGTYGSSRNAVFDYTFTQRVPDWDATITKNKARADGSSGYILRNSVNNQWTIGAVSKLRKEFAAGLTTEIGVDWRTAEIDHYREVRDLLGGQYYVDSGSQFWTADEKKRRLGDKINYFNTNTVDWFGLYAQAEKSSRGGSVYGVFGWARNSYTFVDHFKRAAPGSDQELRLESGGLTGLQIKGGAVRNVTSEWSLFGNAGYVSKVPIFDGVIDDSRGVTNPDPKNEKFLSFEAGVQYRGLARRLSLDLNVYHTTWRDRTRNLFVRNIDGQGNDGLVNLLGVDARHMGIEATAAYEPSRFLRFDAAASLGNWKYLDDVSGRYTPEDRTQPPVDYNFFIKDLKVADAPQTQFAYGVSVFPLDGLYVQGVGRTYANHYAEFSPFDRTKKEVDAQGNVIQPWQAPGYTVFDLHASYRLRDALPVWIGGDLRFFVNVYNLFDEIYIQDAVDNSSFNAFDKDHDADDAEVFFGYPRSVNLGFQISF